MGKINNGSQGWKFWMLGKSGSFRSFRKGRIDMLVELDDFDIHYLLSIIIK